MINQKAQIIWQRITIKEGFYAAVERARQSLGMPQGGLKKQSDRDAWAETITEEKSKLFGTLLANISNNFHIERGFLKALTRYVLHGSADLSRVNTTDSVVENADDYFIVKVGMNTSWSDLLFLLEQNKVSIRHWQQSQRENRGQAKKQRIRSSPKNDRDAFISWIYENVSKEELDQHVGPSEYRDMQVAKIMNEKFSERYGKVTNDNVRKIVSRRKRLSKPV